MGEVGGSLYPRKGSYLKLNLSRYYNSKLTLAKNIFIKMRLLTSLEFK